MPLTDVKVRTAKPAERAYKLADSGGLHLFISPAGGKLWRYRYEIGGKERLLSIGPYPAISLAEARAKRDEAKAALRAGKDPSAEKRLKRASAASHDTTFEHVAREWHSLHAVRWARQHAADVIGSLEREIFPVLGSTPVGEIDEAMVLDALRPIEKRPAVETARRIRQRMSAVFVYAIASGRARRDPAAVVKGAMAPLPPRRKQAAVTTLDEARKVLAAAEAETAHPVTKLAMRILALTVVRSGALRGAAWTEFEDLEGDEPLWRIPGARMKGTIEHKTDHLVPLPFQAVEALHALKAVTGRGPLAFPSTRHAHKPMSENTIGYLLNRAGYHHKHTPHGWRATFSTVMNERYASSAQDRAIIDLMLSHTPSNKIEGAYNRAAYMPRRRELAQEWADLLLDGAAPVAALLDGPRR